MKNSRLNKYAYFLAAMIAVIGMVTMIYAQQKKEPMSCPMMDKNNAQADCPLKSKDDCPLSKKQIQQSSEMSDDLSKHTEHLAMVMQNGEKHMGFSQTQTTHHFLLMKDGGAIQVEVNDPADTSNRDKIRNHLKEIAKQFAVGIFTTPFAVHGRIPPGIPVMDELKQDIRYKYEETDNGARVRISTQNPKALVAIYEFIKFQIKDHQTGDSTNVEN